MENKKEKSKEEGEKRIENDRNDNKSITTLDIRKLIYYKFKDSNNIGDEGVKIIKNLLKTRKLFIALDISKLFIK